MTPDAAGAVPAGPQVPRGVPPGRLPQLPYRGRLRVRVRGGAQAAAVRGAALPLHARVRQEAQLRQLHMQAGGQQGLLSGSSIMHGWRQGGISVLTSCLWRRSHVDAAIDKAHGCPVGVHGHPAFGVLSCGTAAKPRSNVCIVLVNWKLIKKSCRLVTCAGVPLGSLRRVPAGWRRDVPVRQGDVRRPVVHGQGAHVRGHVREAAAVWRPQASRNDIVFIVCYASASNAPVNTRPWLP